MFHIDRHEGTAAPGARSSLSCSQCDCSFVYPLTARRRDDERWSVLLRCPNCERRESRVLGRDALDSLDRALDEGADELLSSFIEAVRSNMADEADRFAAALEADAILPMDF